MIKHCSQQTSSHTWDFKCLFILQNHVTQSTKRCSHLLEVQALLVPAPAAVYAARLSWQHSGLLEDMQVPLTWFSTSPSPTEPKLETGSTAVHKQIDRHSFINKTEDDSD